MNKSNINIKLIILPIVIIVSMIILSFVFSQKIQLLKKEIDLIYFGNFVPNYKLNIIQNDLLRILYTGKINSKDKTLITYDSFYHEIFNEPRRNEVFVGMESWLVSH